ncbi:ABC transporter ATP-binding protein [Streptomyces sp. LBUM 1478]|uniref:hypothetical protein n=1 Tax=Streptomyces scabiei TaxID=1930 RepID=UPI00077310BA|nr:MULTISPECIES: hypothetical protein [Streptomyces]MBP5867168.1 ABC transporter ATP-binding protein [Streptomyces sp. LBUM 1485]MBP5905739.1 ABC transporter ATP-binding protein [Streptomyces sp. LBUM 1478]MBP5931667.1 ABC transporter ATP-binding protein [Streptomyces sp. LBUM 1479]MDX3029538.1 hypothetical protein [Streptomyces scabiei]MDX3206003.1 hypothetical protein [Streptomyces scabiei]
MIEGYGFVDHALPRMLPSLAVVALASLSWLVPLRSAGSHGWILLGGVAVVTLAAWGASTVLVRRLRRFSHRTAVAILVAYATMPVAVPLLQLAVDGAVTPPGGNVVGLLGFVIFFAAAFVATLLATTYGLGTLLRRAVRHSVFDLRNSVHLLGRALPALLFVTLFLFFTGELWQAMNRLAWWRVVLVVVLFAAITVLAAAARLRDEIGRVEQDLSLPTLAVACRGTPLADVPVEQLAPEGQLPAMPLTPRQERNLLLMLASRQLVQAAVVGLALFTFFLALGVLVVTPGTAERWIGEKPQMSALFPVIPVAMLRNATLLAAFGSMYFAVTSMTDADHRQRFFAPIIDEIEHVLTVHAVYLAVIERTPAAPRGPGTG